MLHPLTWNVERLSRECEVRARRGRLAGYRSHENLRCLKSNATFQK